MNWGLGRHSTARTGVNQSISQAYQVWCPHVAQGPRLGTKQAQATSLAAPSYASGGSPVGLSSLADDAGVPVYCSRQGAPHARSLHTVAESHADVTAPPDACNNVDAMVSQHAVSWATDHRETATLATGAGALSAGACSQHPAPLGQLASSGLPLCHTRLAADRTAEASSSVSSTSVRSSVHLSNRRSRSKFSRGNAALAGACSHSAQPVQLLGRGQMNDRSGDAVSESGEPPDGAASSVVSVAVSAAAAPAVPDSVSVTAAAIGIACPSRSALAAPPAGALTSLESTIGAAAAAATSGTPARQHQPLTLERLRQQTDGLRAVDLEVLQQRLAVLGGLLHLDDTACLMLCRIVPTLLLVESSGVRRTWHRLCVSLGGEEVARTACASAPLLLVLPSDRVPACVSSIAAATAMPRGRAAAFVAEWPQLATHALPSLTAKLEGLRALLGPGAGPAHLRCALLSAPRLLTFSAAALARHHAELSALLGADRLRAALRREPGLLLLCPTTVAAKLRLLQQLMDCEQHPAAVAALVVRRPGVLRRSVAALSRGCRALSIWQFRRRDKLRMVISRPELLTLPPAEVHGRCRWLRRLMLSNGYYHSALRRLPPSLVATVVAALPQAWARLQYLAESSQECRMPLMVVVECRQEDFMARFPEFARWLQFKLKLMGADNPWRGALRIRGFTAARDKPAHDASAPVGLQQRTQRVQRVMRRRHQQHQHSQRQRQQRELQDQLEGQQKSAAGPSVPVVVAEACEVRSGGSTVSRPRRVLRQPLGASPADAASPAATPLPSPLQSEDQSCGDGDGAAPSEVLTLPPVGLSMAAVAARAPQPQATSRTCVAPVRVEGTAGAGVPVSAAASATASAAELPR